MIIHISPITRLQQNTFTSYSHQIHLVARQPFGRHCSSILRDRSAARPTQHHLRSFVSMANQAAVKRAEDFVTFLNDSPTRSSACICYQCMAIGS
jgi:hypothetical protein